MGELGFAGGSSAFRVGASSFQMGIRGTTAKPGGFGLDLAAASLRFDSGQHASLSSVTFGVYLGH